MTELVRKVFSSCHWQKHRALMFYRLHSSVFLPCSCIYPSFLSSPRSPERCSTKTRTKPWKNEQVSVTQPFLSVHEAPLMWMNASEPPTPIVKEVHVRVCVRVRVRACACVHNITPFQSCCFCSMQIQWARLDLLCWIADWLLHIAEKTYY